MDTRVLTGLLERELGALRREIAAYPDDDSLWARPGGIANPGGALARHMAGNLRHFVGARLGGSGYVRDRQAELAHEGPGRDALIALVDAAAAEVAGAMAGLDPAVLEREFPDPVGGHRVSTGAFLLHLLAHLAYHLGQIDYHRRMVTGSGETVDAVAVGAIPGARREG